MASDHLGMMVPKIPQIIELAKTGKFKTGADIARKVGCSRERVRQVLNKFGIELRGRGKWGICSICGIEFWIRDFENNRITCSMGCFKKIRELRKIKRFCRECNKTFYIDHYYIRPGKGRREFCSRNCWGRFWGKHWGGHQGETRSLVEILYP